MKTEQWNILRNHTANIQDIPMGLIIDSPWIPGYVGISTLDYFTIPEKWFEANLKVKKDFPEVIMIPDFWVEYGMATEPSGFGCKINFFEDKTPAVNHILTSVDELENIGQLKIPNPETDGLMPLVLNLYRNIEPKVKEIGESIKIVAARGPLTIASHLMSLTEFLMGLKIDPDNTAKLLKMTTTLTKNWLEAQADVLSEVEGILVLDDVVGFLAKDDYLEFAHPYFKEIFDSFPGCLKIYHNDTDNPVCFEFLESLGVDIFNFTYKQNILETRKRVGDKIRLLGNIPPLEVLAKGTPEMVCKAVLECLKQHGRDGIILSAGGGTSPGTPKENIRAMIEAVQKYSCNI